MSEFVDIPQRLMMFWIGWNELSSCRPPAYSGFLPIPWTAVNTYATRHNFSQEEFDLTLFFNREMDQELAVHHKRKAASSA